jgi:EF hand
MRIKHSALILTAGFLLMPTLLWSQLPGMGGGPPGGGGPAGFGGPGGGPPGMGMGGFNPEMLFDRFANGKDVIRRADLDERGQRFFDRFAPMMGITNGELTREQFRQGMARGMQMMQSGQLPGGMTIGAPGAGAGGPGMDQQDRDRRTEQRFQQMDQNQNGVLEFDEMSDNLKAERDKYDLNHDGVIDLNEYKAYMQARRDSQSQSGENRGGPGGIGLPGLPPQLPPPESEERQRPTIYRAGNLPRDFPYARLDTDLDGQIGLYEWKAGGMRIGEFLTMDLNGDGFLTVEEFYRWRKQSQEEAAKSMGLNPAAMANGRGPGMGGGMMGGGGGMFAMGNGGFGNGGRGFGMGGGGFGVPGMGMGGGDRNFGPGGNDRGPGMMSFGGPGSGGGGFGNGAPGFGMGGGGRFGGGGVPGMGMGGGGFGNGGKGFGTVGGGFGNGGQGFGMGGGGRFGGGGAPGTGMGGGGFTPQTGAFAPPGGGGGIGAMTPQGRFPGMGGDQSLGGDRGPRGPRADRIPGMGGPGGGGPGGDRGPGGGGAAPGGGRRGGGGGPRGPE